MITSIETKSRNRYESLGNLVDFVQTDQGLIGQTDCGKFRISVFDHGIIRISITRKEEFDDFSYAVVGGPKKVNQQISVKGDQILLSTALLDLHISKYPVRFKFLNKEGHVVNEDDPGFGTSWIGDEVTTYKKLQEGERFIGLGEKTGNLDRRGAGFVNWNTDNFAYPLNSDPLYCSTPFYIGIHNNLTYGIFFDNSNKSHFNFGASNDRFASFMAEDGDMDYYFIYHDNVADIIESYTYLTGRMDMPPMWSLGYQQCRYSYYPDQKIQNIAKTFRQKKIPADVIVLDIHYMDAYKIFTWHPENFPDPKKLIDELREMGFHVVLMCDPGIKKEEGYTTYEDGLRNDVFLKYPDDTYYTGEVWPGWCHFPDFTKAETRNWWGQALKAYTSLGIEGFWNDMNEIATWGQMMPEHVMFDYDGETATTKKGRNVYGMQMARSTYEGAKEQLNGKRPFNLTRAGFSGIQRYAAVWTGDNVAEDEHMLLGVRLVNSFGITGVPFTGYDIGGFSGEASVDLFARWISLGSLSPFFRGHSMINSRDAEPWAFGEEVEEISRNYIQLRYRLMPYIYSVFHEATATGMPISRSLAIDYTHDQWIYDERYQNQYLFGPNIFVAPVPSDQEFCKIYLPEGEWYDFHSGKYFAGSQHVIVESPTEKLPMFIRGGAIIPMQCDVGSLSEKTDGILTIHIYYGRKSSHFEYYEDDGETFKYAEGEYYKRQMYFEPNDGVYHMEKPTGSFKSRYDKICIMLHNFKETTDMVEVNEQQVKVEVMNFSHLKPITKFDPVGPENKMAKEQVKTFTIDNVCDNIKIVF
ncbi:glycoside hydrolase family 31 protein [Fulvivirgaceae bacterium BMA10]|uniref:Glycoside hydrolase family 31 protein n=1 Tax=Splendidivirga corallicola TaxID=3051826 RepID=A0ABT8KS99_9BACT|nr:glycoside hydrolase family 31 protein [Fulvivirgaceae bacterium BMA10]